MQTECKFVVEIKYFHVDNFRNIKYPQKRKKIPMTQIFCGRTAHNFTEMMPG